MVTLGISLCILVTSLLGLYVLHRGDVGRLKGARIHAIGQLTARGLSFAGDPSGSFELRGQLEGMDIELRNRKRSKRPGVSREEPFVCIVSFESSLPDQLVCRLEDIELVMGPLSEVPNVRTGDTSFDAAYATFVHSSARDEVPHFRAIPGSAALSWTKEAVMTEMLRLELLWLRVREGRCELAFPPISNALIERVLLVGVNFSRASSGKSASPPEPTEYEAPAPVADAVSGELIGMLTGGSLLAALAGGVIFPSRPWLMALNAESLCGPAGSVLVQTFQGGLGRIENFYCAGSPLDRSLMHRGSLALLGVAVVLVVGLTVAVYKRFSILPAQPRG